MIDIGVNLLHKQFADDRHAVIARARAAGVEQMLITATEMDTSRSAIEFCRLHGLYCTAGVHPHDAANAQPGFDTELAELARDPLVRAIGETGLDFNRNFSPPEVQRQVFATQIALAEQLQKPLFVHDRDSNGEVFEGLFAGGSLSVGVVVHCFTGSRKDLLRYLDAGCYIGITGWVCDERRGQELRALIREIPLERVLLETDAPFLMPSGVNDWPPQEVKRKHRRRNEPALLPMVAATVAELLEIPPAELAAITTANARLLFEIPQPA